jgi:hypothetical protein
LQERKAFNLLLKEEMMEKFGIETSKKEKKYILRDVTDREDEKKGIFYLPNVKRVRKYLDDIKYNLAKQSSEQKKSTVKEEVLFRDWFIYNGLALASHISIILILMTPIIALVFLYKIEYSDYSLSDDQYLLTFYELTKTPWLIFKKMQFFEQNEIILISIALVYGLLSFFNLILYYMSQPELKSIVFLKEIEQRHFMLSVLQRLEWIYIFLMLGLITAYISLLLEWALLGAILNPTAYLPYAAGAGTFVAFLQTKIVQFKRIQQGGVKAIKEIFIEKFSVVKDEVLRKLLLKAGLSENLTNKGIDLLQQGGGNLDEKIALFIDSTSIGEKLKDSGFSTTLVLKASKGDKEAMIEIGRKSGIPQPIIRIITGIIYQDLLSLEEGLSELTAYSSFQVNKEIMHLLIELLLKPNRITFHTIISQLSGVFLNAVEDHLPKEIINSFEYQYSKVVFPQLLETLKHSYDDDQNQFLNCLGEMNKTMLQEMNKRAYFLSNFDDNAEHQKLFLDDGGTKLGIRPYMIDAIELFRIIFSFRDNIEPDIVRGKLATYSILKNACGIEKDLLDFLSIIYTPSFRLVYPSEFIESTLLRKEQKDIFAKLAARLDIPSGLFNLLHRMAFGEKKLLESLNEDLLAIMNEINQNDLDFPKEIIEFAFALNAALFKPKNLKQYLISQGGSNFSMNLNCTKAIVNISSSLNFNAKDLRESLETSSFMLTLLDTFEMTKFEFTGFVGLLMGSLGMPEVDFFINNILKHKKIPDSFLPVTKSLLNLFITRDLGQILTSAKILSLPPIWILLGKKLVHPKYLTKGVFKMLGGTSKEHKILQDLKLESDYSNFKDWMKKVKKELKRKKSSEESQHHYHSHGNDGKGKCVNCIERLLGLEDQEIQLDVVKTLLMSWKNFKSAEENKELLTFLAEFLLVKDLIIPSKKLTDVKLAHLAKLFGCDLFNLKILTDITRNSNCEHVKSSFYAIIKANTNLGVENNFLMEYGRFVSEELKCIDTIKLGIQYLSTHTQIPQFIVSKLVTPYIKIKVTLDDIYSIYEKADFTFQHYQNLIDENLIAFDQFQYLLASLISGNLENGWQNIQFKESAKFKKYFGLLKGIAKNKAPIIMDQIQHIVQKRSQKLGISHEESDIIFALVNF